MTLKQKLEALEADIARLSQKLHDLSYTLNSGQLEDDAARVGVCGDELRAILDEWEPEIKVSIPELNDILVTPDEDFTAWAHSLPENYWARYDLSAAKLGFVMAKQLSLRRTDLGRP